ncbi:hypothetical protein A2334_01580 [Candidatus Roizmanbacteria bacterium RIFOXYB2_FULL_38_10]|uniref:O-antigen ligase-related domain-containing protein n=1 Tax=Candidatus Roizmanbacteria bacterium RIFOXYD1_FULL_38_12 TaxID=1802093 RepID=A0A1F7L240_9BACT|nr:MAG: hypothetical protein A3K47_05480 [Candidatus Roizmanbacteria bacterium RIFOXYA2_FULL_38_14]OGK64195.1 MAG: hypothetical protein A3K27_05480 [Candidatus Roizmanbacteria bacterium RIFOXYA1_FULL_37_12]OGK66041.1 MAG: hypothetical protein A3K38_05480 [Candidatus Roizmanbacteria bacterium RIFOXYB1_FULL_40_23]OGK68540.1 MAG: hypothetical protein A2334_01580 [Candidatus Roizmanbacteria bacterium RIFOXYB2_FULL_38_10]OGK70446.1 MAG: hypothetical protein A3K21_05485 [Candidatus Roizmanbacteria ba
MKKTKNRPRFFDNIIPSLFFLLSFLLPSQLGKHFFLGFSYLSGIRIDYLAPTLYLTDILICLLAVLYFKTVFSFFRSKRVLFFLFIISFTGIYAISVPLFLYRILKLVELCTICAIFQEGYAKNKKSIIAGFACSVFFQAPLVITQFITKHSLQGMWYFFGERYMSLSMFGIAKATMQDITILRPYGTFSHPNSLAGFFLLIYVFFLTNKQITNTVLKYAVIFFCSLFIFLSFSKNAILTYVLLTVWYTIRERFSCKICSLARLSLPIFLAAVFMFAQTDPASLEKRVTLLKESLIIIAKSPLTGVGLGNYLLASHSFPIKYPYFFLQPVHNIFLLFAAETGLVIFVIALFFFIRFIKKYKQDASALFVVLAICLTGLNDHYWITLQQNWLLMGVIFGIIVSWHPKKTATV